ncbi:MAG: hypothetical protein QGG64_23800 [Candidatus Latescibacteria bacterium]|nr:hypothetical protein [Candidatus Latescibacterota bacterium]
MKKHQLELQRMSELQAALGYRPGSSTSTLYQNINDELFPPPIKLFGGQASAFIAGETSLVIAARAAGKSDEEIKKIVKFLIGQRQKIYSLLLQAAMQEEIAPIAQQEEGNPIANECKRNLATDQSPLLTSPDQPEAAPKNRESSQKPPKPSLLGGQ